MARVSETPSQLAARLTNPEQQIEASLDLLEMLWPGDDVGMPGSRWVFVIEAIDGAWGAELSKPLRNLMLSVQLAIKKPIKYKTTKEVLAVNLHRYVLPALHFKQAQWKNDGLSNTKIRGKWRDYLEFSPLAEAITLILAIASLKERKRL